METDVFFAFESPITDKSTYKPKLGFAYVDVVSSLNTQSFRRIKMKIQDIGAKNSGILSLLFIIGAVFTVLPASYSVYGTCI